MSIISISNYICVRKPRINIHSRDFEILIHSFQLKRKTSCKDILLNMSSSAAKTARAVAKRILARGANEGMGDIVVRRSLGGLEARNFDPFLLLDEAYSEGGNCSVPDHPHKGFETVTYILQGALKHEDMAGYKGYIEAGDLQWMTAGRGIMHSEVGGGQGTMRALQLWVNLSTQQKKIEPNYQELKSKDIPGAEKDGVKVRVIAGEAFGVKSAIYTRTPTMYLHFILSPGAHLQQPIPTSWNAFVYVTDGEGVFGDHNSSPSKPHTLLLLGSSGDYVEAWNRSGKPLQFILVAGQPLNEPIVQYGPFVMNTHEEIEQSFRDFRNHTNGFEKAKNWRSEAARRHGFF